MEDKNVEMHIDIRDGYIVQRFKDPLLEVHYEPTNAMDVAMHMADLASELRGDITVPGEHAGKALKDELIERHRMTLTRRLSHVLGSERKNARKSDGQLAQTVVDICLSEIF